MTQEKSSNEVLSEQLSEFFPEENAVIKEIEEVSEEVKEVKQITEPKKAVTPHPLFEDMEEGEEETDEEVEESEDEDQDPEVEERKELDRRLSGQPKEFKDLVKSVQDKELQAKILDAGKIVRAREVSLLIKTH